ncbi:uncharacterized protein L201_004422 [Kwoniella dendrophila CBS 6074]|uniref:FAD-binding domain-containing protein n=1 Tax=Kwoniella dendrophila CBS 6074 TaxID=1295534 RepID=A0AAX4JXD3_9TREE
MSFSTSSPEPIVIIGAGPSGLLLAKYLEQNEIPVVVYEGDPSPDYRPQGGSLDLHEETGLLALKETNLLEDAQKLMRSEGEAMKVVDKTGKIWLDENESKDVKEIKIGELAGRPEIDRTDLRNLLIQSIKPTTIKWDHKIKSIKAINNSLYEITFENKPNIKTPYLIGADGTFSLVRSSLLHDIKPNYSGCSMYELEITSTSNLTKELEDYIGKGSLIILDEKKAFMVQMNSNKKAKIYLALNCSREFQNDNPLPISNKKEWLYNKFFGDDWLPQVKQLIMASEENDIKQRKIYQFDPNLSWKTDKTGVTVIGDSAHQMSPFAGEGVNQALADALLLGQTLVPLFITTQSSLPSSGNSSLPPFPLSFLPISSNTTYTTSKILVTPSSDGLYKALRGYEKKMMKRAKPEMKGSMENMDMFFGDQAAKKLSEFMNFHAGGGISPTLVMGFKMLTGW